MGGHSLPKVQKETLNLYQHPERRTMRLGSPSIKAGGPTSLQWGRLLPLAVQGWPQPQPHPPPAHLCMLPAAEPPGLTAWGQVCPAREDKHGNPSPPFRLPMVQGKIKELRAPVLTILWACWGPWVFSKRRE